MVVSIPSPPLSGRGCGCKAWLMGVVLGRIHDVCAGMVDGVSESRYE